MATSAILAGPSIYRSYACIIDNRLTLEEMTSRTKLRCEGDGVLVIDPTERFNGTYLQINARHLSHVGARDGRALHYCFIPHSSNSALPQIILSSLPFDAWGRSWRLTATLKDRPGLVHDIANALCNHGIGLLSIESQTLHDQGLHGIEAILSTMAITPSHSDIQAFQDSLELARWELLAKIFGDLEYLQDGLPRIKLRPLYNLWRAYRQFQTATTGLQADSLLRPRQGIIAVQDTGKRGDVGSVRVPIPPEIRPALRAALDLSASSNQSANWGFVLPISDTKDRTFRAAFFREDAPVLHIRVRFPGTSERICQILGDVQGAGFDIITSQFDVSRDMASLEAVVSSKRPGRVSSVVLKKTLEDQLKASSAMAFGVQISYGRPRPRNEKDLGQARSRRKRADRKWGSAVVSIPNPENEMEQLYRQLLNQHTAFSQRIQFCTRLGDKDHEYQLLGELLQQYEGWTGSDPRHSLFVSCHFRTPDELATIKGVTSFEPFNFQTFSGEHLAAFPTLTDGLVEVMNACTHFLGVWSLHGSIENRAVSLPSPMLLLELGVAAANNLNIRLMVHKDVASEAFTRLRRPEQITIFSDFDFEDKLREALSALKSLPSKRRRVLRPLLPVEAVQEIAGKEGSRSGIM